MKLLVPSAVIAFQICTFVPQAVSQQNGALPERLHLTRNLPRQHPRPRRVDSLQRTAGFVEQAERVHPPAQR